MSLSKSLSSPLKIAIVGPESTGKSAMARFLSEQLNTIAVPEYARFYCEDLNNNYTLDDEINMFYGQVALEKALLSFCVDDLMVLDTTILTIKIWSDHLFGHTPEKVLNAIKQRRYDLYLLMDIDLPWEDDPLRDFPDKRDYFMEIWTKELNDLGAEYRIISGIGEQRFENGLAVVREFIQTRQQ